LIVEFRRLRSDARPPEQAHPHDAGFDIFAAESLRIEPGERAAVATGIALAIPDGFAGFVLPRSGLAARHGIALVNAPGLIDPGYHGEVRVLLLNTDRAQAFHIENGERIAQLVLVPISSADFKEAVMLSETARGEGGFGSTGKH
jgi:dUTP pyrophosphatase